MNEDGFTLAEALAALLIIGLAMGGLFEGARVLARMQKATAVTAAEGRQTRTVQAAFRKLVSTPDLADAELVGKVRGDPSELSYACGAGSLCGAWIEVRDGRSTLRISGQGGAMRSFDLDSRPPVRFVFISTHGRYLRWPSGAKHGTLRAVSIVQPAGGGDIPILSARVWIEQSRACEFDLISRTCRTPTP